MAESTGFDKARTLHSGLGLGSEEDDANRSRQQEPLSADLIIVDEFSMVDMWLADKFSPASRMGPVLFSWATLISSPVWAPGMCSAN